MRNSVLNIVIATSTTVGEAGFAEGQTRQPTKGRVPDEAFENGRMLVPCGARVYIVLS
jgi:hypothetical protein